jgi:tetratricopeptide (TPR) repeat protein
MPLIAMRPQNCLLVLFSLPLLLISRPVLASAKNSPVPSTLGKIAIVYQLADNSPNSTVPVNRSQNHRKCFVTDSDVCIFGSRFEVFGLDLNITYRKVQLLAEIAAKYSEIGQYNRATQITETLVDSSSKALALVEISNNSIKAGDVNRAEQLLSQALLIISAVHYSQKAEALPEMAISFARHGQGDKAEEMLSLALQPTQAIKDDPAKNFNLFQIALKMAEAGQYDQAIQVIQLIQNDHQQDSFYNSFWYRIPIVLAEAEQVSQILEVAQAIKDNARKADVLYRTAVRLAEIGQFNQAIQVAQSIEDNPLKASALQAITAVRNDMALLPEIGLKLTASEKISDVLQMVVTINNESVKALALRDIALKLASQGQASQAWEVVRAIQDDLTRGLVLSEIVLKLTESRQFPLAIQVVQAIEDIPEQDWEADMSIAQITFKLAQARQFSQALQVAGTIKTDSYKVFSLINIADQYIEAGQTDRASEVLSQAVEIATSDKFVE